MGLLQGPAESGKTKQSLVKSADVPPFLGPSQEGKSIKSSSGFSGKGFKFDETEHALANERKKLQKAALGLQDSDDEEGALDVRNSNVFACARWKSERSPSLAITV